VEQPAVLHQNYLYSHAIWPKIQIRIAHPRVVTGSQVHVIGADEFTQVSRITLIGPQFQESKPINFISPFHQFHAIAPAMISNRNFFMYNPIFILCMNCKIA